MAGSKFCMNKVSAQKLIERQDRGTQWIEYEREWTEDGKKVAVLRLEYEYMPAGEHMPTREELERKVEALEARIVRIKAKLATIINDEGE